MQELISNLQSNFSLNSEEKNLILSITNKDFNIKKAQFIVNKLIKYKLDIDSIIAYLAYEAKFEISNCNEDITFVYNSLKTDTSFSSDMTNLGQAEELRKMFIAMNNDVRVLIIRLCSILYDVSTYSLPLEKDEFETLINVRDIFAPLAERLGLNSMKSELEDICLKNLNPKIYKDLESSVMLKQEENEKQIEITTKRLEEVIKELNLKNATIMARRKHFSSIYKKIKNNNVTLANIYDLIAVRVIVDTVEDCYLVLGKIHGIYRPMAGRFKDYIASPKENGYQSLHTTIIAENSRPLEIQIRTHEMHKESEFGVFAHWLYKEKRSKMTRLDRKISWLREVMENSKDMNSEEFVETLKTNLCEGRIFVQTPKGKVIELAEGATVLDFAYAIHTEIGNNCVGGKINNFIKPLATKLKNGDIVEIITSQNSKGPSKDWLKIVATAQAKSKINAFFRKELREENIKAGIKMLELAIKAKGYVPTKLLVDKYLDPSLFKYAFGTKDELFASIGHGSVPVNNICNKIVSMYEHDHKLEIQAQKATNSVFIKKNKDGVLVDGDSGMLVRYAGCCSPVYGEEIIGYISRGRGVTIHRADCKSLKYLESERLISALWDDTVTVGKKTNILIKIISAKSDNFLVRITQDILGAGYRILGLDSKENLSGKINTVAKIEVSNQADIAKVLRIIKDISSVEEAYRLG